MTDEPSIVRATLRALLAPRRVLPVLLLSATLVLAQRAYSRDPRAAWVGISLCLAFVLVAPLSFRVLFPEGLEFRHGAVRLLIYGVISVFTVHLVGIDLPSLLGVGATFLTAKTSVPIDVALFMVGGWGLGRDIGFEASLLRERQRAAALAREAEHAQLLALRAQLDPHFLFNTLNAIAEWCRTDGETAERAVLELASLLRAVLTGVKQPAWSLGEEMTVVRTVLGLHLRRDPDMFTLDVRDEPSLAHVPVPPLLLLPLAENAVKHGPARGHRGRISVSVAAEGDRVRVTVENPGAYGGPRPGSHGLPTIERRLAIAYDGAAALTLHGEVVHGEGPRTVAAIELPTSGPMVTT
ncbi:MAG: histidine kinase [Deltaproteobacteria bacterium]|nr:histidine kinase [Deltaproteobacteria bacterium]